MFKNILVVCMIFLSSSASAWDAERTMVFFGGGGEPENSSKLIYDETVIALGEYFQAHKWKHFVAYGANNRADWIRENTFKSSQNHYWLTNNNYNAILVSFEKLIRDGKIKSGDQLLFMIASRGAMKTSGEDTHQIAILSAKGEVNPIDLSGTEKVSLDAFKKLTDLAKQNNIKLAIIDFSNYSGNTLALANNTTCVISAAGTDHSASPAFSKNFIGNMAQGKSLEDVFLSARKVTVDDSFPMIASPS